MMNAKKKDYLWNTIGVFAQNAISPLLLVAVTRINGVYDAGIFSYAMAVAIIFWAVAMWGGRTYQVSDMVDNFTARSYLIVRLLLAIIVLVASLFFCAINGYSADKTALIVVLVGMKIIESVADMLHGVLQRSGRLYVVGMVLTFKALVGVVAFTLVNLFTRDILLASLAITAVTLVMTLLLDWPRAEKLDDGLAYVLKTWKQSLPGAIKIIKICAPIFGMTLLAMLSLNIPRYFLDIYHEEELGFFGIIAMPITLIVLVMSFILQPQVVQLSHLLADGQKKAFNRIVGKIMLLIAIIGLMILCVSAVAGVPILNMLFGVSFDGYYAALIVVIVGAIINAGVGVYINILVIMRRFKSQFYILLITNAILSVTGTYIVGLWGLLGAVWLFTVANLVQIILLAITYTRSQQEVFNEKN